jgi:hypothetical protein
MDMPGMTFGEIVVVMITAVVRIGIPVAVAVWVIQTLRRIRSDNDAMKAKLEAIEKMLHRDA